ncbi:MAG: hypothetical protein A2W74_00405 [Planctomycetes bacterium RIFCSPLOWO2_12_38_17]|nr:MAG: hypothetical protein UT69_C0031G0002 [Candidatus Yanofskybacteria bacterium GW2011_GWE1_40_10]OGK28820.1 MAG: hypothetical protein A3C31_02445 [Candidatus Roizmanbacteria bacterium RIFCSPHIGHO2_02_FULL_40_53]OHB97963.1 MAG: hypothetical protein A2W74_00405 [Planctomycetes bacterium RIFCSPLOWO2_12_38_17]
MKTILFSGKKGQQMDVSKLQPFIIIIVLVAMVIGIGIITLDKMGATTFYTLNNLNESITLNGNYSLTNLGFGNVTNVDRVINSTGSSNSLGTNCWEVNMTAGQFTYKNNTDDCRESATVNIIYDAKNYATATVAATRATSAEVANISSSWMGLIITIVVLAIILGIVLVSFSPDR